MKKIFGWAAIIGGTALEIMAVTGGLDPAGALLRSAMVFAGLACFLLGLVGVASGKKTPKYTEFDIRDFYYDELEERREQAKHKESWDSIKEAQK